MSSPGLDDDRVGKLANGVDLRVLAFGAVDITILFLLYCNQATQIKSYEFCDSQFPYLSSGSPALGPQALTPLPWVQRLVTPLSRFVCFLRQS